MFSWALSLKIRIDTKYSKRLFDDQSHILIITALIVNDDLPFLGRKKQLQRCPIINLLKADDPGVKPRDYFPEFS